MKDLLIIFIKNPQLGKVKTRLAQEVGEQKALEVYLKLLAHTRSIAADLDCTRWLFYSDSIDTGDQWGPAFEKRQQSGDDLGMRMLQAFKEGFEAGYNRVCIIGSDCWELESEHLREAFEKLGDHELCLGPARDGGYYLLGMKQLFEDLFRQKKWSTESVLKDTLKDIHGAGKSCYLLDELSDIDTLEDLRRFPDLD